MNTGSMTAAKLIWQTTDEKYRAAGRKWQGIPGIERTRGGRLIAAWYSGMDGETCGNFVVVEKSDDGGVTWTDGWLIVEHEDPRVRCFDECVWHDPEGQIWLFWAQCEGGLYDGRAGVWEIHTSDADSEKPVFTAPRRIANGVMLNKPTVLKDGRWLLPCALWEKDFTAISGEGHPELDGEIGANIYVSEDGGETFRYESGVRIPERMCDEHSVIEKQDGALWLLSRTSRGIGQAFSYDGGKTWKDAGHSGLSGPNARFSVSRLQSGELLLINHINPTNALSERKWKKRDNLMAMLSKDDGKTWVGGLMLDARSDVSYPDVTEGPDGRIYVIYDRDRFGAKEILLSVFRAEDVLAGYPVSEDTVMRRVISAASGKKE